MTRLALIGAGPMARAYGHALRELGTDTMVVGRGEASAKAFTDDVGLPVLTGGLTANADTVRGCTHAIVAAPVPALSALSREVVELGVPTVLVEKPAGLNLEDVQALADAATAHGANVFVAYNRRFYASVREAKRRIEADGGPTSFRFEISEWSKRIADSPNTPDTLAAWFLANSSHVIDMAFFLGGYPTHVSGSVAGSTGWHEPAVFVGHGVADTGALFSYHGDWNAAPRWMVEVGTRGHTYMFNPLETLRVRTADGFAIEEVELPGTDDDRRFKPGILRQTEAFVHGSPDLLGITDHAHHLRHALLPMLRGQSSEDVSE